MPRLQHAGPGYCRGDCHPRHCHGDGAQCHGGRAAGGFSFQPRFPGADESCPRAFPPAQTAGAPTSAPARA